MQTYRISALAREANPRALKGTIVKLPPPTGTLTAEIELRTAIRAVNRGLADYVRQTVLPSYTRIAAQRRAELRDVAVGDDVAGEVALAAISAVLVATAERTVRRILGLEAQRHTAAFKATSKRALGIDLSAVVRDEDLADVLEAMVSRNVALIKGLSGDVEKQIATAVSNAYLRGEPATVLRKTLTKRFGVADSRAKLIARDQIGSVTSELSQFRHQQAGITHYDWSTSLDERVRPLHEKLDGMRYEYGKPTGAEQGLPPGGPIQCRCVAIAEVVF